MNRTTPTTTRHNALKKEPPPPFLSNPTIVITNMTKTIQAGNKIIPMMITPWIIALCLCNISFARNDCNPELNPTKDWEWKQLQRLFRHLDVQIILSKRTPSAPAHFGQSSSRTPLTRCQHRLSYAEPLLVSGYSLASEVGNPATPCAGLAQIAGYLPRPQRGSFAILFERHFTTAA